MHFDTFKYFSIGFCKKLSPQQKIITTFTFVKWTEAKCTLTNQGLNYLSLCLNVSFRRPRFFVTYRFPNLHWLTWLTGLLNFIVPDFYLWGFFKSRFYTKKPQTLVALKENIRQEESLEKSHQKCCKVSLIVHQLNPWYFDRYYLRNLMKK